MKTIIRISLLLVLAALCAFAQVTTIQTTLASAMSASDTSLTLTSSTGLTAKSTVVNTALYIDREYMQVLANAAGNVWTVARVGGQHTAHASGALVWVGPPGYFSNTPTDPTEFSPCTATSQVNLPRPNYMTGNIWDCYGSQWVKANQTMQRFNFGTATPGIVNGTRIEVGNIVTVTSATIAALRATATIANATTLSSGTYLYGIQGKAVTGTGTMSGAILAGVFAKLDVTGGTISAGHVAALQSNLVGATGGSHGAPMGIDGLYIEHAAGGIIDSGLHIFGKMDYVLNFETNTDNGAATKTTGAGGTCTNDGWLKIKIDGNDRYINLCHTGS